MNYKLIFIFIFLRFTYNRCLSDDTDAPYKPDEPLEQVNVVLLNPLTNESNQNNENPSTESASSSAEIHITDATDDKRVGTEHNENVGYRTETGDDHTSVDGDHTSADGDHIVVSENHIENVDNHDSEGSDQDVDDGDHNKDTSDHAVDADEHEASDHEIDRNDADKVDDDHAIDDSGHHSVNASDDDSLSKDDDELELYDQIRLPQSLRPTFYQISFFPHIFTENSDDFRYECETIIHITCVENTRVVRLHSLQQIYNWTISGKPEGSDKGLLLYNPDKEMIEIHVGFTLTAGETYVLTLNILGEFSSSLRGIYVSPYKEANTTKYIITTMMEPTDARRVFPCFDEPDFKAIFTFRITRKSWLSSVTNLPLRETLGPNEDDYCIDIFDQPQNVPMSTYLVAFAVGDLGYIESSVNNITFRTISRKSAINQTRYALDVGMKFMEFFEEYFDIPYSLPKEDMIAVPTMSFSGMEHWGLITYRENAMLYEEGVSSLDDKEWTTIIVAHEIAHQWFGNLMSPHWWDDLWLNEGFATYMMYLAVDRVMPEWNMINKLIVDFRGVQNVMSSDDNILSHPVYVSVEDPVEITQIFDLISYAKGGSVIRMMNFFLGEETFRKGLTRFLRQFSYKTATHRDLFESLSEQAREDSHTHNDVMEIMSTWILEANYPVVMVTKKDNVTLELKQTAFLRNEAQRRVRENITWKIPFAYTTNLDGNFDQTYDDIHWLDDKTLTVTDNTLPNTTWVIGNVQQYGFYRVNYDRELWEAILHQLGTDHEVIHPINRAQIINDAWNIARAGMLDYEIALRTLDYLDSETDFVPWKAAIRELDTLKSTLQATSTYGAFESFMRSKLEKAYLNTAGATSHYKRVQYNMIAKAACQYGLQTCLDDAMKSFQAWSKDSNERIHPDLKETVYCTGVKYGGIEAWEKVLQRYKETKSVSEIRFLSNALACTNTPWILYKLVELVFNTDTFSKTDGLLVLTSVFEAPIGRLLVWSIVDSRWNDIIQRYGEDIHLLKGILTSMAKSVGTYSQLHILHCFIRQKMEELPIPAEEKERFNVQFLQSIPVEDKEEKEHFNTVKRWLQKMNASNQK